MHLSGTRLLLSLFFASSFSVAESVALQDPHLTTEEAISTLSDPWKRAHREFQREFFKLNPEKNRELRSFEWFEKKWKVSVVTKAEMDFFFKFFSNSKLFNWNNHSDNCHERAYLMGVFLESVGVRSARSMAYILSFVSPKRKHLEERAKTDPSVRPWGSFQPKVHATGEKASWTNHSVPTLLVKETMYRYFVIDPVLFGKATLESDWREALGKSYLPPTEDIEEIMYEISPTYFGIPSTLNFPEYNNGEIDNIDTSTRLWLRTEVSEIFQVLQSDF